MPRLFLFKRTLKSFVPVALISFDTSFTICIFNFSLACLRGNGLLLLHKVGGLSLITPTFIWAITRPPSLGAQWKVILEKNIALKNTAKEISSSSFASNFYNL